MNQSRSASPHAGTIDPRPPARSAPLILDTVSEVPWRHVPHEHPAANYVMRVSGWIMLAASISDGDYVVVDRSVEARPGHIVVALVHGDRTMKRLRRRSGQLWLVPEAGDGDVYPETLVDQDVEVWGVVVGLDRRMVR